MPTFPLRRILAAVDLSNCSRAALAFACRLAEPAGAKIEVLLVKGSAESEGGELASNAAAEELHRFIVSIPEAKGAAITERIEAGDARERIVTAADQGHFDAIVLGTHGRTGRPRSLAGSVAESVVRTAACPVITVRERI
ncbi:MAG TPA: universal stress protein [Polyangiaceae bacterium]|nr:universal stress protein [Polyangiaceae bacterium]